MMDPGIHAASKEWVWSCYSMFLFMSLEHVELCQLRIGNLSTPIPNWLAAWAGQQTCSSWPLRDLAVSSPTLVIIGSKNLALMPLTFSKKENTKGSAQAFLDILNRVSWTSGHVGWILLSWQMEESVHQSFGLQLVSTPSCMMSTLDSSPESLMLSSNSQIGLPK